jgi:membrane-bound lytic murein transglycosylase D
MYYTMIKTKAFFLILLFVSFFGKVFAENDTIILKSDDTIDRISMDLDSLANDWYVRLTLNGNVQSEVNDSAIIEFPDSIYEDRISRINSVVFLPYNKIIRNHIHVYTGKQQDKFRIILGLQNYYFPMIEDIFESYGIPAELKYMAVIESALNPNAVSRMGATGLWQFMYSTGRMYGLTVNSIIDERRDPVKATYAAARYLKDLFGIYNDWMLAIAAYNCGPGNVNKAIARSGNKKDYWGIYNRLPRETRGYIPQYVAATYAMTYYKDHNIKPIYVDMPFATDTVMINKDMHLAQISEVLNIPLGELKSLNPQYRTGMIPGKSKPMSLTLPITNLGHFIELHDTIVGYKSDVYLSNASRVVNPSTSTYQTPDVKGKTKLIYIVQSGDNLGYISEWYKIGLSSLRSWNNIYGNTIREGQKLVIYVDPSTSDYYSKVTEMSFAQKQAMIGKPATVNQPEIITQVGADTEYIYYTVRNGDTLWDIVKKFENVTEKEILSINSIKDASKLQVGQQIKIKRKG